MHAYKKYFFHKPSSRSASQNFTINQILIYPLSIYTSSSNIATYPPAIFTSSPFSIPILFLFLPLFLILLPILLLLLMFLLPLPAPSQENFLPGITLITLPGMGAEYMVRTSYRCICKVLRIPSNFRLCRQFLHINCCIFFIFLHTSFVLTFLAQSFSCYFIYFL